MEQQSDTVTINNKRMLMHSHGKELTKGEWYHVVLLMDGVAWRPMRFGIDFVYFNPTGFKFIPLPSITEIRLKPGEFVSTKVIQFVWRGVRNEQCALEMEISFAQYWVPKLRLLGINVLNADIVDSKSIPGFLANYGLLLWCVLAMVAFTVTLVVLGPIAFLVSTLIFYPISLLGGRLTWWFLYGGSGKQ